MPYPIQLKYPAIIHAGIRYGKGRERSGFVSDEDGIPDDIEKMIGTDPLSQDTDEDELGDYMEAYFIGSDPLVWDSITSGVSDGDADSDEDGISNKEEQRLGTNPLKKDTDGDGLDDIEELDDYGTDPLKRDTDDDGIEDADELKLGLDPANSATYGVKDSEYPILQTIDANSDVFSRINTADNAYRMYNSIDDAKNRIEIDFGCKSHYMTIIGYTKYPRGYDQLEYGYILKVESWGDIYYINYDEYAEKLSIFRVEWLPFFQLRIIMIQKCMIE